MSLRTERILRALREVMTTPTLRDEQTRIGPSDLGNPCNLCLAAKMAGEPVPRSFSLYPWLGTAIHHLIEWTTEKIRLVHRPGLNDMAMEIFGHPTAVAELHIEKAVFIPGYGWCPAHIDYLLPNEGCLVDWKSSSRKKVKAYRARGFVPTDNVGQTLIYLHAAITNGYPVESAVLVYIPRDAATLDEIWAYEVQYDIVEINKIIERAANIQLWIDAGRWKELDSDPDCMTCNPGYFGS